MYTRALCDGPVESLVLCGNTTCVAPTIAKLGVVLGWLLNVPENMLASLGDGSAQTSSASAVTLRLRLVIGLAISPSHSILTPGEAVPAPTL